MTVIVKTKTRTISLPAAVRQQAGFKVGQVLEFKAAGGVVTIVPKLPAADDEYTPKQRAIVDAHLAEGLEDIRKGRVSPKFDTVDEMLASLKAGKRSPRQTSRPMKWQHTGSSRRDYEALEEKIKKAFDKQVRLLADDLLHPSLRAKKYDDPRDIWQARVNRAWLFISR